MPLDGCMKKFDFKFSVLCPACGNLVEISHFSIEVIADGVDLGTCECGATIQCHLTQREPDGEPAKYIYCECPSCHATGLPELFIRRR